MAKKRCKLCGSLRRKSKSWPTICLNCDKNLRLFLKSAGYNG